jgi:hypothetical protein
MILKKIQEVNHVAQGLARLRHRVRAAYVAMDISGALQWDRYSFVSRTISELAAIDSPSRPIVVALGIGYSLLAIAFGFGVWRSANRYRTLRIAAGLLIAYGAVGLLAPLVPMHPREAEETLTDTMHIVLTMATVLLILSSIAFGAAAGGRWFRHYSLATLLTVLVFGTWTGLEARRSQQISLRPGSASRNVFASARGCCGCWCSPSCSSSSGEPTRRTESSLHLREPPFGDT